MALEKINKARGITSITTPKTFTFHQAAKHFPTQRVRMALFTLSGFRGLQQFSKPQRANSKTKVPFLESLSSRPSPEGQAGLNGANYRNGPAATIKEDAPDCPADPACNAGDRSMTLVFQSRGFVRGSSCAASCHFSQPLRFRSPLLCYRSGRGSTSSPARCSPNCRPDLSTDSQPLSPRVELRCPSPPSTWHSFVYCTTKLTSLLATTLLTTASEISQPSYPRGQMPPQCWCLVWASTSFIATYTHTGSSLSP